MKKPACFDSFEQYAGWKAHARIAPPPPKQGVCYDCTPKYKAAMLAEGRCEHPEVKFYIIDDELCGMRSLPKGSQKDVFVPQESWLSWT